MLAPRFKVSLKIWSIKKSRAFFHWIKWVLEVSKQRGKVRVTNGLLLFLNRQLEVVYWQLKMEPINDIKRRPEERCKRRNSNCFMYVPFFHEQSGQFWLCSSCTSDHKLYNASKQPTSLINIDSPPMSFPKNIIPLHAHSINLPTCISLQDLFHNWCKYDHIFHKQKPLWICSTILSYTP